MYKVIHFKDLEEMLNQVREGVIKQGEPSILGDTCRYRGPNGLKCAVGHIIPDEIY